MSSSTGSISPSTPSLVSASSSQTQAPVQDDEQNLGIVIVASIVVGVGWVSKQTYRILKHVIIGLAVVGRDLTYSGHHQGKKCLLMIKKGPIEGMRISTDVITEIYRTHTSLGKSGSKQLGKTATTQIVHIKHSYGMIFSLGKYAFHTAKDLSFSGYHQIRFTGRHISHHISELEEMINQATLGIRLNSKDLILSGAKQTLSTGKNTPIFISDILSPLKDFVDAVVHECSLLARQTGIQAPKAIMTSVDGIGNLSEVISPIFPPFGDLASSGARQMKKACLTGCSYFHESLQPFYELFSQTGYQISLLLQSGLHQMQYTFPEINHQRKQYTEPLKEIRDMFQELFVGLSSLKKQLQKLKNTLPPIVGLIFAFPLSVLIHLISTGKDLLKSALRQAVFFFRFGAQNVKKASKPIIDVLQNIGKELMTILTSLWNQISRTFYSVGETISESMHPIYDALNGLFSPLFALILSGCRQMYYSFHTLTNQLAQYLQPIEMIISSLCQTALALFISGQKSIQKSFVHGARSIYGLCQIIWAVTTQSGHLFSEGSSSCFQQTNNSSRTFVQYGKELSSLTWPIFREFFSAFNTLRRSGVRSTAQFGKQCKNTLSSISLPIQPLAQESAIAVGLLHKTGYHQSIKSLHTAKNHYHLYITKPIEGILTSTYPLVKEGLVSASHQAHKLHETLQEGFSASMEDEVERSIKNKISKLQKS